MLNRSQIAEQAEDKGSNTSPNTTMGDMIAARFSRRDWLRGALAVSAISATVSPIALTTASGLMAQTALPKPSFDFKEIKAGGGETHDVAEGYDVDVLIRWGDPVLPGAPRFNPHGQTAAAQRMQFGYNNDYVAFLPIPDADASTRGLLVVNHEYTNEELMFPGLGRQDVKTAAFSGMTRELVDIEMAAHGGSVLELRKQGGRWTVAPDSKYARRITADTPIAISGPVAGHPRVRTKADPEGREVLGTINNCAGGLTPWGTWLTCEENFNNYFMGDAGRHPEASKLKRYGVPAGAYAWAKFHDRFDVSREPNEPNRFGWVVEIDPFDPASTPRKRTAMGRFKHEGAAGAFAADRRWVVYQGDDERFDYVYKFVTERPVDMERREANRDLLDEGTLYVAKYEADGTGRWLALRHGDGPLTAENGFASQADVLIDARIAADLLGATKMDRPEDVEANPKTGKVYVMLTNNTRRKADQTDAANPRGDNRFGHIVEMSPDGADHAALTFRWEILVRCGDPSVAAVGATFSAQTTRDGWFGMPDNLAVDNQGRIWIATDGNSIAKTGRNDGLWALETEGALRGTSKHFFRCPAGAEMCGPYFTPDDETLFLAVQHPGESDEDDPASPAATFENPATRWPDFQPGTPPRPAVLAISRKGGGKIA